VDKAARIKEVERTLAEVLPEVDVVDVEIAGTPGKAVLRVFIDHPDGVDHELCVQVTGLLDHYLRDQTIEVSSPGLERRLRKPEHFLAAVGEKINLKTFGPVEGKRNFTGFLFSAGEGALVLELDQKRRVTIPLDSVASARTVFEFGGARERKQKKHRQRKKRH